MRVFVEAWSAAYDDETYSRSFYFAGLEAIRSADRPTALAGGIVKLLHWKDGKVRDSSQGLVTLGGGRWNLMPCKPNIYNRKRHGKVFESEEFWFWAKSVRQLDSFDLTKVKDIQGKRFNLWSENSIVIPSFVLHVLNPRTFPLFDQHVTRAMRILCNKSDVVTDNHPSLQDYVEYQQFWRQLINDLDLDGSSMEPVKQVDEALWSFGKWLKQFIPIHKPGRGKGRISDTEYYKQPRLPAISNEFTPDRQFKLDVMALVRLGTRQKEAMQIVADKLGVKLAPSYTKYPGSHIDRWRKQGY